MEKRRKDIKSILKDPKLRQQLNNGVRRFLWALEINPDKPWPGDKRR